MKKLLRLTIILTICISMAGVLSACSTTKKGAPKNTYSFKHQKPLPKKYIIKN